MATPFYNQHSYPTLLSYGNIHEALENKQNKTF